MSSSATTASIGDLLRLRDHLNAWAGEYLARLQHDPLTDEQRSEAWRQLWSIELRIRRNDRDLRRTRRRQQRAAG